MYRGCFDFVFPVSQADGISLTDVDAFTTLMVRTDNSVYQITILQPYAREVVVQGGAFFPERTRACLSGSSFGGSCLKLGWVGVGLHMEFCPFPNIDGGKWQVSRGGGIRPVWAPDGRELFYRRPDDLAMMAAPIETEPTFSPGNPGCFLRQQTFRDFRGRAISISPRTGSGFS